MKTIMAWFGVFAVWSALLGCYAIISTMIAIPLKCIPILALGTLINMLLKCSKIDEKNS